MTTQMQAQPEKCGPFYITKGHDGYILDDFGNLIRTKIDHYMQFSVFVLDGSLNRHYELP